MNFLMVLFVFLLPLASIAVSVYCLIYISGLKKTAMKLAAMGRLSGKAGHHV